MDIFRYKINKYESKYNNTNEPQNKQKYGNKLAYYKSLIMKGGVAIIFGTKPTDNSQFYITMPLRQSIVNAVLQRTNEIRRTLKITPAEIADCKIIPHISMIMLVVSKNTENLLKSLPHTDIFYKNIIKIINEAVSKTLTLESQNLYKEMGVFIARQYDKLNFPDGTHKKSEEFGKDFNKRIIDLILSRIAQLYNVPVGNHTRFVNYDGHNYVIYDHLDIAYPIYNIEWNPHISLAYVGTKNPLVNNIITEFNRQNTTPTGHGSLQLRHVNLWPEKQTSQITVNTQNGPRLFNATGHLSGINMSIASYNHITKSSDITNLLQIPF